MANEEQMKKAENEIELLKKCIKSYFSLKSRTINFRDAYESKEASVEVPESIKKRIEIYLKNFHKIYYRLDILALKSQLYEKKENIGYYQPYFGNALYYSYPENEVSALGHINEILEHEIIDLVFDDQDTDQDTLNDIEFYLRDVEYQCKSWEVWYRNTQFDNLHNKNQDIDKLYKETEKIRNNIYKGALIESFNETTDELKQLKKKWYKLFFGVVGCLVFFGIAEIFKIDKITVFDWYWIIPIPISSTLASPDNFNLNTFLHKVSFILPLIWLAWFAAKRLNILSKLETDYQFKEATAKTFESYKNEIEAFKDDELKKQLLSTVIRNFGDNPVRLFDPKDDKGHTTEELLELAKKLKDITK
jgi:hypothetical protein